MRQPASDADFEWTVSDKPFDDSLEVHEAGSPPEASASKPQAQLRSLHLSRRTALILVGAALGALLLAWLGSLWGEYQTRQALAAVIAAEEAAIRSGDLITLAALADTKAADWQERVQRASARQAAPEPAPLLSLDRAAGELHAVQRLGPDLVRVDVTRSFTDFLSGDTYRFALPQFYRREGDGWKRVAPPQEFWGKLQLQQTGSVAWAYPAVDAPLVEALDAQLEDVVGQACEEWGCSPTLSLRLTLQPQFSGALRLFSLPSPVGSRLLSLPRPAAEGITDSYVLSSPHATGFPVDEASRRYYTQTLALLLIEQLAQRSAQGADEQNPFRLALAVRLASRLGLDSPRLPELFNPNPAYPADALWREGYFSGAFDAGETLRGALVIVNRLLADQPRAAEPRLLAALGEAASAREWVARGLNLDETEAAWRLGLVSSEPWPIDSMLREPKALVLECADGPQAWSPGDERPAPLIDAYLPGSYAYNFRWSPNGQRLAVNLAGQSALVDPRAETIAWLPKAHLFASVAWVNDSVVIYRNLNPRPGDDPGYHYFDIEARQLRPAFDNLVHTVVPSPDGKRLALARGSYIFGTIYLVPALVDPAQLDFDRTRGGADRIAAVQIDTGAQPAWSPNGRFLLYSQSQGLSATFKIADTLTGETRVVFDTKALGENFARRVGVTSTVFASGVWSPTGEWVLLTINVYDGTWLVALKADGSDSRVLVADQPLLVPPAFSADGGHLAFAQNNEAGETGLYVSALEANTTQRLRASAVYGFAWAPTGPQLLVADETGVRVLADGRRPNSAAQRLTGPECSGGVWNPRP